MSCPPQNAIQGSASGRSTGVARFEDILPDALLPFASALSHYPTLTDFGRALAGIASVHHAAYREAAYAVFQGQSSKAVLAAFQANRSVLIRDLALALGFPENSRPDLKDPSWLIALRRVPGDAVTDKTGLYIRSPREIADFLVRRIPPDLRKLVVDPTGRILSYDGGGPDYLPTLMPPVVGNRTRPAAAGVPDLSGMGRYHGGIDGNGLECIPRGCSSWEYKTGGGVAGNGII